MLLCYCLQKEHKITNINNNNKKKKKKNTVCPCWDAGGTLVHLEIIGYSWAPIKPPRGQTLRSPRPKVTSALIRIITIIVIIIIIIIILLMIISVIALKVVVMIISVIELKVVVIILIILIIIIIMKIIRSSSNNLNNNDSNSTNTNGKHTNNNNNAYPIYGRPPPRSAATPTSGRPASPRRAVNINNNDNNYQLLRLRSAININSC